MTEFLTRTTIVPPVGVAQREVDELRAREAVRAAELADAGILLRLWRPPVLEGEWKNVGLWSADDEEQLRVALDSLPLRAWMTIEVTPLSPHPNDPAVG